MNNMNPAEPIRVGVLSLARPTFDVAFAEKTCAEAWKQLVKLSVNWVGSRDLLFDAQAVEAKISDFKKEPLDLLLILQLTFTDASMTVKLAKTFDVPILFWSFPEKRTGGRLRLNSLCGVSTLSCRHVNMPVRAAGQRQHCYSQPE